MRSTTCGNLVSVAIAFVAVAAHGADATPAAATNDPAAPAAEAQASIPFANHGGIYDWRVLDNRTVLIQGLNRQWYKASLMGSCFDLPFAQRIGFQANPDGSFDKFSSIRLRHQNCPLVSLVKAEPPTKKSKRHANAEVTTAAPAAAPAGASSPSPSPTQ